MQKYIRNIKDQLKDPLTFGMTLMTIFGYVGGHLLGKIFVRTFDMNHSVGWWLDVKNNWLGIIPEATSILFVIGYYILALMLLKTNFYISLIHFILIVLGAFLFNFWELHFRYILYIYSTSVIIFGYNLHISYAKKEKTNL